MKSFCIKRILLQEASENREHFSRNLMEDFFPTNYLKKVLLFIDDSNLSQNAHLEINKNSRKRKCEKFYLLSVKACQVFFSGTSLRNLSRKSVVEPTHQRK